MMKDGETFRYRPCVEINENFQNLVSFHFFQANLFTRNFSDDFDAFFLIEEAYALHLMGMDLTIDDAVFLGTNDLRVTIDQFLINGGTGEHDTGSQLRVLLDSPG